LVAALARAWAAGDIVYLTARKPADGERAAAAARAAAGPAKARIDWLPFDLVDREGAEDAPPERDARPMIEGYAKRTACGGDRGAAVLDFAVLSRSAPPSNQ
jgi:hypothetical protein